MDAAKAWDTLLRCGGPGMYGVDFDALLSDPEGERELTELLAGLSKELEERNPTAFSADELNDKSRSRDFIWKTDYPCSRVLDVMSEVREMISTADALVQS